MSSGPVLNPLLRLTGLTPDQLAEVLADNPRAYMAVKGAVAEKHLFMEFEKLKQAGKISSFIRGQSDFEKDFYVTIPGRKKHVAVECKNVEVVKCTTKQSMCDFLDFLVQEQWMPPPKAPFVGLKSKELETILKQLPQNIRESGVPRYEFSARLIKKPFVPEQGATEYLEQFAQEPLTIDFQRTRNSKGEAKGGRYYEYEEVEIVAACLFSRTLSWQFVYAASPDLECHPDYPGRIHCRMEISPRTWHADFLSAVARLS